MYLPELQAHRHVLQYLPEGNIEENAVDHSQLPRHSDLDLDSGEQAEEQKQEREGQKDNRGEGDLGEGLRPHRGLGFGVTEATLEANEDECEE